MRKIFALLLCLSALAFSVSYAQTSPTINNRSGSSNQQSDEYLIGLKRLGIPTSATDNLDADFAPENTRKLLFNTTLNKLRVYNPATSIWADAAATDIASVTGLQAALDGKENISNKAIDLTSPNNTKYPTTQAVTNELYKYGRHSSLNVWGLDSDGYTPLSYLSNYFATGIKVGHDIDFNVQGFVDFVDGGALTVRLKASDNNEPNTIYNLPSKTAGTYNLATTSDLDSKANHNVVVKLTGNQTIMGDKEFAGQSSINNALKVTSWEGDEPQYGSNGIMSTSDSGKRTKLVSNGLLVQDLDYFDEESWTRVNVQVNPDGNTYQPIIPAKNGFLAMENEVVKLSGNQNVNGIKTFSSVIKGITPLANEDLTTKSYVDGAIHNANIGGGGTLQQITDNGSITTNSITVGSGPVNANSTKLFLKNDFGKVWALSSGSNQISENDFSIWNWSDDNANPKLIINSDGNVAVGKRTALAKLDVAGNAIIGGNNNSDFALVVENVGSTNAHGLYVNIGQSSTGVPFRVDRNSSPILNISNNENVEIGNVSAIPSAKLRVNGVVRSFHAANGDNSGDFENSSAAGYGLYTKGGGGSQSLYAFRVDSYNGATQFLVDGIGNVGIGTTPATTNERLTVNGKIRAREVKVEPTNGWPDYVFEEDYKPLSLSEISSFVKKHKHLPEVPSAKEIAENGLELGEMNKLLLKKVEELTLYLIEKERQLKVLEERVSKLEKP